MRIGVDKDIDRPWGQLLGLILLTPSLTGESGHKRDPAIQWYILSSGLPLKINCLYVCWGYAYVSVDAHRVQKRVSISLEPEF